MSYHIIIQKTKIPAQPQRALWDHFQHNLCSKPFKSEQKQRKTAQNCKKLKNDATAYNTDTYIIIARKSQRRARA
jgi:hypothetical protein